jgi:hypothetical protein
VFVDEAQPLRSAAAATPMSDAAIDVRAIGKSPDLKRNARCLR